MMKKLSLPFKHLSLIVLFCIASIIWCKGQSPNYKEQALEAFKNEHYDKAIHLMEQAAKSTPKDADVHYYLGFFNHYRAYDSRPLKGYNYNYSEQIFKYLDRAIALDPNHGNARYFYGAECSGNAFLAMQNNDEDKLRYFYKLAYKKGAYPNWLLEYGRNYLNSCEANAILFTAGNADVDVCSYLQLHENHRTDITLVSIGMIDRPWYIRFLKNGLPDTVKKININLTNHQIDDMHPYKWKTTPINIPYSQKLLNKYDLPTNHQMNWVVEPDFTSERQHSKSSNEKAKNRTYLSPRRALLLQIIEDNYANRPIYFSATTNPVFFAGLEDFFQNCGLVYKLLPLITDGTNYQVHIEQLENLFQYENIKHLNNASKSNMPRVSRTMYVYHYAALRLADHYKHTSQQDKLSALRQLYKKQLLIGIQPEREQRIQIALESPDIWDKQ